MNLKVKWKTKILKVRLKMQPENIVAVSVSFSIIGALLGGYGAYRASQQQSKEQTQLREKAEENAALSKRIAELNEQIAGNVTGGNSFCYIRCGNFINGKKTQFDFVLLVDGIYPMYSVKINIIDYSKVDFKKENYDEVKIGI